MTDTLFFLVIPSFGSSQGDCFDEELVRAFPEEGEADAFATNLRDGSTDVVLGYLGHLDRIGVYEVMFGVQPTLVSEWRRDCDAWTLHRPEKEND